MRQQQMQVQIYELISWPNSVLKLFLSQPGIDFATVGNLSRKYELSFSLRANDSFSYDGK